jgi:putative addiction module killer protein
VRFDRWLKRLRDRRAVVAIVVRLNRAQAGNLGDCKPVGGGVCEMRIRTGPGYRLYYTIRNRKLIVMLCGGDKSTQRSDIAKAKEMEETLD